MTVAPEPFAIAVPDAVFDDLQQRLALTRWPDDIPATGWQYGSHLSYIQELVHYWQHQYAWRAEETGYQWIQGTRPQTLAYALNDPPATAWAEGALPQPGWRPGSSKSFMPGQTAMATLKVG